MLAGPSPVSLLSPSEVVSQGWPGRELVVEFLSMLSASEGRWRLVTLPPPYCSGQFALYGLSVDLAEPHDVSSRHPDRMERLLARDRAYRERYGVIEPDRVSGY